MYKCSDCGKEFTEKPEFCDCGNIFFEQITEQKQEKNKNEKIKPDINNKKTKHKKTTDPVSIVIFVICIILSILSLIFIGNKTFDKTETIKSNPNSTENAQINKNIPSIDNLWKEPETEQTKTVEVPQKKELSTVKDVKENNIKENKIKKETKKTIKPVVNENKTGTKKNNQPAKIEAAQPKQNEQQKKITEQDKQISQLPKEITLPVKPQVDIAAMKKELSQYKIELRNKIAADINFTRIIGDGKCIISFKINSNGELTNRTFLQKSDNDSLNDAVYSAIIKNPAYKNPPALYKNETLKFSVKIYGGQFEVNLI